MGGLSFSARVSTSSGTRNNPTDRDFWVVRIQSNAYERHGGFYGLQSETEVDESVAKMVADYKGRFGEPVAADPQAGV